MDAKTLQKELGISQATYYRMVREGMPYKEIGKSKIFELDEVKKWIELRQSAEGISDLVIGQKYTNNEIATTFKCSTQGGMRRSHATNTLILFTDHSNPNAVYEDKWVGDVLHYTGMGLEGDQNIDAAQNKTLKESNETSIRVFLFETLASTEHTFRGEVILVAEPYYMSGKDQRGNLRQVVKFPLALKNNLPVEQRELAVNEKEKERKALTLSPDEIKVRALLASEANENLANNIKASNNGKQKTPFRWVTTTVYERNPYIAQYVKNLADGKCQLCEQPAPFEDTFGNPFLESHHIHWLSKGGQDAIQNTVALCSNCHQKMHILNLHKDVEKLKSIASKYDLT